MRFAAIAAMLSPAAALAGEGSFAVVASGAGDEAALAPLLAAYADAGLPAHGNYPRAVAAATLPGLPADPPWVVLVAQPDDAMVAERLVGHLGERGLVALSVPVTGGEPEDLRLLQVDAFTASGNGARLFVYDVCLSVGTLPGPCVAHGRPEPDFDKLLLPYVGVPRGETVTLWAEAGMPWMCTGAEVGPARTDVRLWLKGPVRADCFAPGSKRRRQRG